MCGGVSSRLHTPRNTVYPALLPLMRTLRLPVVDLTEAPADLNGLVLFAERRNLVSARVPSHFNWPLQRLRMVELYLHSPCVVMAWTGTIISLIKILLSYLNPQFPFTEIFTAVNISSDKGYCLLERKGTDSLSLLVISEF